MSPTRSRYRNALIAAVFAAVVTSAVAAVLNTHSQQRQKPTEATKDALLKQIEESVEQPLRIVSGYDCPLNIVRASVKEIAGSDFTRLTGKVTDLGTVSTVPEITLVNSSDKTVTGFVIAIRDPHSQTTQTITNLKTSISPGGTTIVRRDYFVGPEKVVRPSDNRRAQQTLVQPKLDAEKYWLTFAVRSDIYIAVGAVLFDDGTRWLLRDGGDVK